MSVEYVPSGPDDELDELLDLAAELSAPDQQPQAWERRARYAGGRMSRLLRGRDGRGSGGETDLVPLTGGEDAGADDIGGEGGSTESMRRELEAVTSELGQLSQDRAQTTLELLRDKCGVLNVMYPVAMGGTDIFDAKQVATLVGFLESKTEPDFLANVHLDPATPQQIEHGKRLVMENGCASCHEINGIKKPENFAPELTRIGSKPLSQVLFVEGVNHTLPDYVAAKVSNPRQFGPSLKMPQFKLMPQQVDAITTALLAQNSDAAVASNSNDV